MILLLFFVMHWLDKREHFHETLDWEKLNASSRYTEYVVILRTREREKAQSRHFKMIVNNMKIKILQRNEFFEENTLILVC